MSSAVLSAQRVRSPSIEKRSSSSFRGTTPGKGVRFAVAAAILLGAWTVSGMGPDEVEVRWSLQDGDLAVWKSSSLPVEGTDEKQLLPPRKYLGLFGHHVDEEKGARYPVRSVRDIPADLALQVPLGRVRKGNTFQLHVRYDDSQALPYEAHLKGKVVKIAEGKCRVRGSLSVGPVKDLGRSRLLALRSFQGTFDTLFDGERGVVETSEVRILPQAGEKKGRKRGKGLLRLTEVVQGVRLELKEIRRREPDLDWRKEIDESIRKGAAWLKKWQKEKKDQGGPLRQLATSQGADCLAALTLLASGIPRDDPIVESLFEDIRKHEWRQTYEISLGLMAMEAYLREDPEDQQTRARGPRKKDLKWMKEMTRRLLKNAHRRRDGWDWGYGRGTDWADLSNTQYAALGLFAAWRAGVEIEPKVWANLALGVLRYQCDGDGGDPVPLRIVREGEVGGDTQAEERKERGQKTRERKRRPGEGSRERKTVPARGFGYKPGRMGAYGSMTVGGIATLQIVLEVLDTGKGPRLAPKLAGDVREAIEQGWAWMAKNWLIQGNPGRVTRWPLYYLYGLERAGVLCRVHSVNGREWYAEGASWLASTQEEDGSWSEAARTQTCFALLFLKQSTRLEPVEPVDPRKTRERPRRKTPERKKKSRRR